MSHILIAASHITRKDADVPGGDGLHMVDDGMVAISSTSIALIFERSDWDICGHKAGGADCRKLKIDLKLHSIRLVKTHSEFFCHEGATMIVTGVFDPIVRNVCETITIRMSRDDAILVCELSMRLNL